VQGRGDKLTAKPRPVYVVPVGGASETRRRPRAFQSGVIETFVALLLRKFVHYRLLLHADSGERHDDVLLVAVATLFQEDRFVLVD